MARNRRAVAFYTDAKGKTRPITRRNVAASLATGVRVRRIIEAGQLTAPRQATVAKFRKAALQERGGKFTEYSGLLLEPSHEMALVIDLDALKESKEFGKLVELVEDGKLTSQYPRIYVSKIRKHDLYWVGSANTASKFRGRSLKTALRTLGGRDLRAYMVGENQPVMLVNSIGEAVVIAPNLAEREALPLPTG